MKKSMKQLFQKGLSGILCAAMILTSLSIPEMTVLASQTEITEETENADVAKEEGTVDEVTDEGSDKDDADSKAGGGAPADGSVAAPDEDASEGSTDETTKEEVSDEKTEASVEPAADKSEAVAYSTKSTGKDFYYYYVDEDKDAEYELGVYIWKKGSATISADVEEKTWKLEADNEGEEPWDGSVYPMTSVTGYKGWYKLNMTISDPNDGSNTDCASFTIYRRPKDSTDAAKKGDSYSGWDKANEVYNAMVNDSITSYAVKGGKGYANPTVIKVDETTSESYDMVTAIMRNVTLHVYSGAGVPAIMSKNKLSCIDESAGSKEELTADHTDSEDVAEPTWYNYFYDMTAEGKNWYSLTFVAPEAGDSEEVCQLYVKKTDGTYGWIANLNGTDFAPVFEGKNYYEDGVFMLPPEEINLGMLKELIDKAAGMADEEYYYTTDSWAAFIAAQTAAEEVADGLKDKEDTYVDEEGTAIADAYDNLNAKIKGLVEKEISASITLKYYAGDTNGKSVGIYQWGDCITSTADKNWQFWGTDTYEMSSTGYSGWYTIPLTFTGKKSSNTNFQVVVKDGTAAEFPCGNTTSNAGNADIFVKLFLDSKSNGKTFAIKPIKDDKFKLYEGDDVMRNVELYVYSKDGVPAIKSDAKLSYIDESTGSKEERTADETKTGETDGTTWNNYFYDMTLDAGNWYKLTFIAPEKENASDKICELYLKNAAGEYDWKMNFQNGPVASGQEEWYVNFTPVFSGNVYYKDGKFYSSKELAEGITLKMLEDLLTLEKITTILGNASAYTEDSWAAFKSAYDAADTLAKSYRASDDKKSDTYMDDDIAEKYTALSAAADDVVPVFSSPVVTLYYYSEALNEYTDTDTEKYNLYMSVWNKAKIASTKEEISLSQGAWDYTAYKFDEVTDESINKGHENWYTVPVKVIEAYDGESGDGFIIQLGKATTSGETTTHAALVSDGAITTISFWVNKSIYQAITSAGNGGVIAIKDDKVYSSIEDAEAGVEIVEGSSIEELKKLYDEARALDENDYQKDNNWTNFQTALAGAKTVLDKGEEASSEEILEAYNSLKASMNALVYATSAGISVKKVALADDFITGADLSSYVALKQSGVVFKDEDGKALSDSEFFSYLKAGGTNWVRIRIWNDPYNSNGDGYGGGNSDLEKAKIIGKLATDAGMRVLINFHYSDFWADPSKQDAPKAWEGYTTDEKAEAVYNYTLSSLNALKAAGVDVGMVQVGNETNNKVCGESGWDNMAKIFSKGSKAVRDFDANCRVALHFANPKSGLFSTYAKNLADRGVEYDVFAASYYPFWHGTVDNMNSVLSDIAKDYGKEVMVVETSWVTTWEDGDGHSNTSPKTTQDLDYPVSVQGQADEMVSVISAVNDINNKYPGKAIGVFYWEPAWISPYYVYNAGTIDQSLYNKNKELWEKYGSGWASSYAAEYDPTDAGRWYGGSAVDNQAWFDFNGKALETAKIYSYIRTGASATERRNAIVNVENEIIKQAYVGDDIPEINGNDVVITFNDGSKSTDKGGNTHLISADIKWDEEQEALLNTDKAGTFTVDGIVTCRYYVIDGVDDSIKSENYDISLTLEVLSTSNILENASFESGESSWTKTLIGETITDFEADPTKANHHAEPRKEDPHNGTWGMHFYSVDAINFKIEQVVSELKAGTYTVGGFIQGDGAASKDLQTLYVIVDSKGSKTKYESTCSLNGWINWLNPEISNIKVADGDTLTVGVEIESTVGGAWGTIDDMYMYGKYGINLGNIENGTVNVSNMEPDSGEVIKIAAMPENGYYLSELKLIGENVNDITIKDLSGKMAADNNSVTGTRTLTYNSGDNKSDETMSASFVMPEGSVTLEATFTEVDFQTAVDIGNVKVKGFTPVTDANAAEKYVYDVTQEYTGKKLELDLELSYLGYKLTDTDYTAQYKNNTNATDGGDMAEITIKAKGRKFTGSRKLYFNIADTKVDISKAKAELGEDDDPSKTDTYYYTGDEIEPIITKLTDKNGAKLQKDGVDLSLTLGDLGDYTIDYKNNIKVGKATMTVIANSTSTKIKGSFTQTFTIAKRPITDSSISISEPAGATYTGGKIMPNVTVKCGNKVLKKGTDYTVAYKNNVNVSKGAEDNKKPSLKITGKGNYTGTTSEYKFEISPKNINDYGMTVTADDIAEGKVPKITLKDGKKTLSLNKQFKITQIVSDTEGAEPEFKYDESAKKLKPGAINQAGTYTATIVGIEKGGYDSENERTVEFKVIDGDHLLSNAKITIVPKPKPYTGSPVTLKAKKTEADTDPELIVIDKKGNPLYENTDYTISYNDVDGAATNIKAGKATVTIKGKGAYAGTKSAKFTIAKSAMTSDASDSGKAVITCEPQENTILHKIARNTADGDTLYLPYTGYNWMPELNVYAKIGDGSSKLLTKGTDYTISYKKNQKAGDEACVIIKGKGNYSGSAKLEKVFTVKDVTLDNFVITVNPVEYSGKAAKPAIRFVYKETGTAIDLKVGAAYSVKYANNKDVASIESTDKPTVTITEKGLNASKRGTEKNSEAIPFTITTARITPAGISEVKVQTYNGKPVKPALTIKVNGKKLKVGKDYVVTYTGNSGPNSKAKATIIGVGNYSGTVSKEFVIK